MKKMNYICLALFLALVLVVYICWQQQKEITRLQNMNKDSYTSGMDAGIKQTLNSIDSLTLQKFKEN